MKSAPTRDDVFSSPDHWKIRVSVRGCGMIHLASSTEPNITPGELHWTPLESIGDTLGYLDWREVSAVSWRYVPAVPFGTLTGKGQ